MSRNVIESACTLLSYALWQDLKTFLSEGHVSNYRTGQGPDILQCDCFGISRILPINEFFANMLFLIFDKMSLWPDEMVSRAGFDPRAVVWRPLLYGMVRTKAQSGGGLKRLKPPP